MDESQVLYSKLEEEKPSVALESSSVPTQQTTSGHPVGNVVASTVPEIRDPSCYFDASYGSSGSAEWKTIGNLTGKGNLNGGTNANPASNSSALVSKGESGGTLTGIAPSTGASGPSQAVSVAADAPANHSSADKASLYIVMFYTFLTVVNFIIVIPTMKGYVTLLGGNDDLIGLAIGLTPFLSGVVQIPITIIMRK